MVGDLARLTESESANTSLLSSDTYVVGAANNPVLAPASSTMSTSGY